MQIDVVVDDPDFLGAPGTFVAKPARIQFHTTQVVEAVSSSRRYANYRWDVSIVHVVVAKGSRDRVECRCGLVSEGRFSFEIHQRPWSFRENRLGRHVDKPHAEAEKWHRLCSRCVA